MPLEEYRRKRDFGKTPEPPPDIATATSGQSGRFVVQRHRATRLHYDFRLEIDGVLVSWAVPKGPTLDPKVRRMAVHVEDHPIEYFDFEGVIPAKQYGAGDVIVWDWGTWEPEAPTLDGRKSVNEGELKFRLNGEKLKGRFTIVRTSGRGGSRAFEGDDGDQWLLIHKSDEAAQTGWDAEDHPQSVKTGRTNDEVKENRDAIWISQAPAAVAEIDLAGAKPAPMPQKIEPMAATLAGTPFDDDDWLFEIKWDGFRVEAVVDDGKTRILTRNLNDAATYFPRLLGSPSRWIEAQQAIVDGEVVALDDDGRPDFSLLQTKLGDKEATGLVYQVFDLLYLDGRSLLDVPLEDRKRLLRSVLKDHPRVRFASHVVGEGKAFFDAAGNDRGGGDGREAAAFPIRAGSPFRGMAQDQDPAGAGVRGRWLDPGEWQRPRPRCARDRRLRGRQAAVHRQGRERLHRSDPEGSAEAPRAAHPGRPAVRPRAPEGLPWSMGWRPSRRHLGPARDRDPGRDRWLDARWTGPPDGVQGHRFESRTAGRRQGDRGRHDHRDPPSRGRRTGAPR